MTKRILIVEDHEDNRRILRDLLTSAGFELIEAVTGTEGVALANAQQAGPHPYGHSASRNRRLRSHTADQGQ